MTTPLFLFIFFFFLLAGLSLPYRLLPWLLVTPMFVILGDSLALFASFFCFLYRLVCRFVPTEYLPAE